MALWGKSNMINVVLFQNQQVTMSDSPGQYVSVQLQVGLLKGQISVERSEMSLQFLKTIATTFISEKFPEQNLVKISEKILLFRHDYSSPNILQVVLTRCR